MAHYPKLYDNLHNICIIMHIVVCLKLFVPFTLFTGFSIPIMRGGTAFHPLNFSGMLTKS
jgi:hypothetical protein